MVIAFLRQDQVITLLLLIMINNMPGMKVLIRYKEVNFKLVEVNYKI